MYVVSKIPAARNKMSGNFLNTKAKAYKKESEAGPVGCFFF
jgi:hypothetical protein